MADDTSGSGQVSSGQPPLVADPQDPLPESSWFWRRLLTFAGCALCAIGLGLVLYTYYTIATRALGGADTANGAQVTLHAIEALGSLHFWLVIIILVNLTLYLVAPSAEQWAKMLATVEAFKAGVTFNSRAAIATPAGTATAASSAGPGAAPLKAPDAAPAPPPPPVPVAQTAPAAAPAPDLAAPAPAADPAAPPPPPLEPVTPIDPPHAMAMVTAPAVPLSPAIGMVSVEMLRVACPSTSAEALAPWVAPIKDACHRFEIDKIRRVAAFVAQMGVESAGFTRMEENLRYSAKRLTQVWPRRFPTVAAATPYAANPEKLANKVYAGRMGNGDEASGDGWTFRGGGPLQVTGRANWTAFAKAMGLSVEAALAYGRTVAGGVMAAAWFWESNDLNRLADTPGVADESRRINGGDNGLADRKAKFDALIAWMLKHQPAPAQTAA